MTSAILDKNEIVQLLLASGRTRYWCSREPSFAKEGLKVYVAGRTFQKIEAVAAEIHAMQGSCRVPFRCRRYTSSTGLI